MGTHTKPVFIVGSGRSGTRTMFRMLTGAEGLEIHHEYLCNAIQRIAARYYMGLTSEDEAKRLIAPLHGAAIHYASDAVWADSSNKLSWLIRPLGEMFPTAKFLAIVRDGRKVTSSFYYKLREEMYDDDSVEILRTWLRDQVSLPEPPPEKRYWWNIPRSDQFLGSAFPNFDRLRRVAWHWAENCREITERFAELPDDRVKLVRLEELTRDEELLKRTIDFIGIDYDPVYSDYLQTPRNVFVPIDFQLTRAQEAAFQEIAGPMMTRMGYVGEKAYHVSY
ncbi:sulfotransferase [Methylobacterium sp. WL119]|uniref:sulfotransferase n=1 Tax=unclassified Methylobacterium TaxID=2615210 RepID=UPI0011C84E9D|nr:MULTISPECIES: sulfotransferase [unclassified Methylobacterium]TXN39014.1 sulfotransferase [Methylobacterium sp. WL93]TXN50197.1 sulfotransferase [Methylobacterium sp. WL119]